MTSRRIVAPSCYLYVFGRFHLCRSLPLSGAKGACLLLFLAAGSYIPTALATTETAKLVAADGGAGDRFGGSVAMSGDTMVVGALFGDGGRGAAYVFVRSAGTWTQRAKLTASDGAASDDFGVSVAVSGDTVVVGAIYDDVGPNIDQGSAYVFVRPGSGWADMTKTAKLTASDGADRDYFGNSVAVSGDTVVVGAYYDEISPNAYQGSAYVFVKPGGGWSDMTQTAKVTASDGAAVDFFGVGVAVSSDTVVVGAFLDDIGPNANQGSAYVFVKPGGGWNDMTQTAKLTASDGASEDRFGFSVAVSGDTVVVGAYANDIGPNVNQGSAYVFVKPGGGWSDMTQTAKLTASDGSTADFFGTSVAVSGDTVVIGAVYDAIGPNVAQGSAYVFVKPDGSWSNMTQTDKLTASDGAADDLFGRSVAVSVNTVVIGAYLNDIGLMVQQGSAYVFDVTIGPVEPPLAAPAPHDRSKNRYVSFVPNNGPGSVAFKVSGSPGVLPVIIDIGWVGTPDAEGISPVLPMSTPVDQVKRVWSEPVIHVGDCEIIPVASYEILATADGGATFSAALTVSTTAQPVPKFWADTVGAFGNVVAGQWDPPNGVVNVNDYVAVLQKFLGVATAPHVTVVDVQSVSSTDPCLNKSANIADVFLIIKAFQGNVYPFETNPANCPPCP